MSYRNKKDINVIALIGQTLTKVQISKDNDDILFETKEGKRYRMYHQQDCCESVTIESIKGNLDDLIGSPIKDVVEVISNENPPDVKKPDYQDSFTWTTFTFKTESATVVLRWYGSSNGYYGESVSFAEIVK